MDIRIAVPQDAEKLLRIYAPYVTDTAVSFEYTVPSAEEFTNRIANTLERYPYLIAEEDGEILGYAYASAFHPRIAYIHCAEVSIYVAQDRRRSGVGRQLYEALETILLRQNVSTLYACIADPNGHADEYLTDDSEKFHQHMGYHLAGRHIDCGYKFGRWYSMIWMEKQIAPKEPNPKAFIKFNEL